MNKVLIYSIAPEYILNILNGKKTVEVRKRDLPQWALDIIKSGGVVEGFGYETFGKSFYVSENTWGDKYPEWYGYEIFNKRGLRLISEGRGQVVVKFQVSGVDVLKWLPQLNCYNAPSKWGSVEYMPLCLTKQQIEAYGNGADLYAHYLTNITPIEPMELSNFYKWESERWHGDELGQFSHWKQLKRAYQSFGTAWVKGE